ncbi:MAG: tetratricopeptide repeat protein, partial [Dehalococcoidia bacterium]
MRPTRRPPRSLILGLSAVAIAVAGAACSGSQPGPSGAGTAHPSGGTTAPKATATPTAAPADVRLAAVLRYEGQYEKAIDVYAAVATSESGQARQDALLAQAQLLSRTRRFSEARDVLQRWLAGAGASANGSTAQYMLASTLDDLGDPQGALDAYDRYIAARGPAS